MKKMPRWLCAITALLLPFAALAQQGLEIDIVGGNASALPITIVPMPYQGGGSAPQTDVAAVVRADLERSGQFRTLPEAQIVERPTRGSEVQYPTWRALKQDYLVVGRVQDAGEGAYRVEYELFDVAKGERMLGLAMTARSNAMRDVAHQMADAIYEKILGIRGAFWTRIAYVTASGRGGNMRYALMVADSDGYNPQTIVRSAEPLLSPSWSPDGRKLAYVSFERGNSSIYIQDIATGARELVSSFRGINWRSVLLARRPSSCPVAVAQRQSRDLRDGLGQQGADPADQPLRHRYRADLGPGRQLDLLHLRSWRPPADLPGTGHRRQRQPRHLPGQLQRHSQPLVRRHQARRGPGQWQYLQDRDDGPQPRVPALEHAVAGVAG
jgi:Periplasmic component of the Tol biopolymer transport system